MTNQNVVKFPVQKPDSFRFSFTIQRIENLQTTGKTYYVYDTGQPGLCIRVSAGGSKSYVYYRKVDGRPERITLGKFSALSISDARKASKRHEGQRATGINPAAEKRAARVRGQHVDDLMDAWERSAKAKKLRHWADERRLYDLHIKPSLGRKEAQMVGINDIERLMRKLQDRQRTANKVHDLLRRVFKHAIIKKVVTENPCQGVTRYCEIMRDRVLTADEIEKFLEAVNTQHEPWCTYFKLLLMTGARKGAVAAMRWQDLDLVNAVWTIPGWASKNKKTLVIALVPQAVNLLSGFDRMDDTWVFPSNSKTGHIIEPAKAWNRIKQASGLTDVRMHDIRRTVGTSLAVNGASAHVIAKALGHKSLQSAQAYVHLDATVARSALESVTGEWLK